MRSKFAAHRHEIIAHAMRFQSVANRLGGVSLGDSAEVDVHERVILFKRGRRKPDVQQFVSHVRARGRNVGIRRNLADLAARFTRPKSPQQHQRPDRHIKRAASLLADPLRAANHIGQFL
ncbi:MAG TPA: hypothetical protein VFE47_14855 [Tepidisphaeraceae bacterium]|nr:hypothetical protein [Tepidisphaeraceae bacterium]